MPEVIRSLLVVIVLAVFVFKLSENAFVGSILREKEFKTKRNIWFGITASLFLVHSFWIFIIVTACLLIYSTYEGKNTIALVFSLIFAAPLVSDEITGLGIINFLFEINYFRLISIVILLPAYLRLRKDKSLTALGSPLPDKFLIGYLCWGLAKQFYADSLTNSLRSTFYQFIDVILPYYVASRSLKNITAFSEAFTFYVISALLLCGAGLFEYLKSWLLYSSIPYALGVDWGLGSYLMRGADLRASVSTGQPIILGYVLMVGLGCYMWINQIITNRVSKFLILSLLLAGLFAPISRGPWSGAVVMCLTFILLGKNVVSNLVKMLLAGGAAFALLLLTPFGSKIMDVMPFIGTVDPQNVEYRQRLLDNSLIVISRNLWFGSGDFMATAEMAELKFTFDGGIIDLVNSYLAIALSGGLIALILFCGVFVSLIIKMIMLLSDAKKVSIEHHTLGRVLVSILAGTLLTIYTCSSIGFVPIVYWFFAGIALAYIELVKNAKTGILIAR